MQVERYTGVVTNRSTGETTNFSIYAFNKKSAEAIVMANFDPTLWNLTHLDVAESVVKIQIEPFCLS